MKNKKEKHKDCALETYSAAVPWKEIVLIIADVPPENKVKCVKSTLVKPVRVIL